MHLTLVRHGQTIENAQNIIMGQMPGKLTPLGIKQAQETAESLRNISFDAIYSSDLQRAVDTAEAIRQFHTETPFVITEKLRERYSASYQGKVFDPEYWESLPGTNITRRYEGGESWEDVKNRLPEFLNELFEKYNNEHVLLVAHGGIIKGTLSLLLKRDLAEINHDEVPNGVAIKLDMQNRL